MADDKVRVRFAPSPTGHLHVGGARTALFNWLFARNSGGTFILRIEDTDRERSTEESYRGIIDSMRWLRLDWDEGPEAGGDYGPYFQSERREIYRARARELVEAGRAYACFCTQQELAERKEAMRKSGRDPKYDGKCRELPPETVAQYMSREMPHVIRLKTAGDGEIAFDDLVHGRIAVPAGRIDDFIIMKSDGFPTYNFAAAVDDERMRISHIIRGDDHMSNTPRQVLIYRAFGVEPPRFAHVPLIMGPDKARLSKRHGSTSVAQFRDEGYLPEAMVNYLALLGWSYDDSTQLFTLEELIERFSLKRVSDTPAIFDYKKLQWMNGEYMKRKPAEERVQLVMPYLKEAGLVRDPVDGKVLAYVRRVVEVVGDRLKMAKDIVELSDFFFVEDVTYEEKAAEKFLKRHYVGPAFRILEDRLGKLHAYNEIGIEELMRELAAEMGLKAGELIHPVRVALTGRRHSPGIFEIMTLLGKERVLERLRKARMAFA
jgi:glutamyl-tRNA synthetase